MSETAVTAESVRAAAARINRFATRTPLLRSSELDATVGGRVFLKAENLQRSGSFKFRGAMNSILALPPARRTRGVVAYSSGNHALAVAEASHLVGVPAAVIMPSDAPAIKINGCRARGAAVHLYDRVRDDRAAIGAQMVAKGDMTLIAPYDDDLVIAGAGTGALEAAVQMDGAPINTAVICCSGGGLAAGWSIVLRALHPGVRIVVAEPDGFDDTARSLSAGRRLANERKTGSICDALLATTPGERTFPILQACGASGVHVSDAQCLAAMRFAYASLKIVLEPGGAIALAAALSGRIDLRGGNTLLICSGGNVDPRVFAQCLHAH